MVSVINFLIIWAMKLFKLVGNGWGWWYFCSDCNGKNNWILWIIIYKICFKNIFLTSDNRESLESYDATERIW